ncbi:hypothetical protein K1719_045225 [Acacia pycnantha]|nr:hypothetical protein K1719_045225 [Acacia pycnantha]
MIHGRSGGSTGGKGEAEALDLPPSFRSHPTDKEIITCYLMEKVLNSSFSATAIREADLNKSEPWDFPKRARMGEEEWYFFCQRDRKYRTGTRTNIIERRSPEGQFATYNLPWAAKNTWVVCKIFHKDTDVKKITELLRISSLSDHLLTTNNQMMVMKVEQQDYRNYEMMRMIPSYCTGDASHNPLARNNPE